MLDNNWHDEFLEYRKQTTDSAHSAATKFLWTKVSEIIARADAAEATCAKLREAYNEMINELGFIAQGGNTATNAEALCLTYERTARRIQAGLRAALAPEKP
jgi:hypothetical protein